MKKFDFKIRFIVSHTNPFIFVFIILVHICWVFKHVIGIMKHLKEMISLNGIYI